MQAHIGGIVPMSTVDWPRNICTVVFFAGCDFKCPYCQNADLVTFNDSFLKDLRLVKQEIRKNLEFIDAVLFSGGEACLHATPLIELATFAKKLGLKVGIETNGTKPDTLLSLLKRNLVDFVGLDIKAPFEEELFERVTRSKTYFKSTSEVMDNIKHSLFLIKNYSKNLEFEIRTTIVPRLVYKKEDLLKIAEVINKLDCTWVLQQFRSDQGNILDDSLKSVNSPSKEFLQNLKEAILKKYPNMRVVVKGV